MVYYAVNKPKGYVSTNSDPSGRPRVVDLLPEIPERVYTVGRLDEASTGLLILTNDGDLANQLAHPRYGVEKLYRALVAGLPDPEMLGQAHRRRLAVRRQGPRQAGSDRRPPGTGHHARTGPGRRQETRDPPDAVQARPQGHVAQPSRGGADQPQGAARRRMPVL